MTGSYRYVFIFTYGRSGSTLLSGYLNRLPGFCIRGENHMALADLCGFYNSIEQSLEQRSKKSGSPTHPWYGVDLIELEEVRTSVRDLFTQTVLKPEADHHTLGCKEIRIQQRDLPDFDGFLDQLMTIFQDVKFLFNHRKIEDTAQSMWWRDTAHSAATIRAMDDRLRYSRHAGASNVFHVQYEDLIKDTDHAQALTRFLGTDFNEDIYREVLATRHSY